MMQKSQQAEDEHSDEAPEVRQLSAMELKAMRDHGVPFVLIDVRTEGECDIAKIDGSRLLTEEVHRDLLASDRNVTIVFQCHHGIRSQQAAEYFRNAGFRNLDNLVGGIEAWSLLVDPSVPRY
jgi:rhodanese-related sulfurtransferase